MPAIKADQRAVWWTQLFIVMMHGAHKLVAINQQIKGGDQIITLIRGEMAALGADITAYSLWNTVWSTVDHCWHYDLAKLTKSEPESHSVTIIHMTRGPLFQILSKLKLKSLMAMTACLLFLSSSLDQIAVLGQLRGHWHVHELICNAHLKRRRTIRNLFKILLWSLKWLCLQLTTMPPTIAGSTA